MNDGSRVFPRVVGVGGYLSPTGGSKHPALIREGQVCFEIIREGAVYGFDEPSTLHGEGSVFCHQSGQSTVSECPDGGYYACLVVTFDCIRGNPFEQWPRCFQWRDRRMLHRFADEMLHAFHYAALDSQVIGALLFSRLVFQYEQYRGAAEREHIHPKLRLAMDYINRHFEQPITLDSIADAAGISVSHLHMLFRESLNESPHQFLIQKRMRAAAHALVTTGDSIKVVAANLGYANTENFCRAFRKFFGRSASEYRNAYADT